MTTILTISASVFLAVWIIGIGWQVGYFKFLSKKLEFIKRRTPMPFSNEETGRMSGVGVLTSMPCQRSKEHFERSSLIQKSRRLLLQGLLFGFAGVLAMAVLFIVATRFGSIYLIVGLVIVFPALIFFHMRSNVRYLINVIRTTPCPRCGKLPMDYLARSKDERRLLICTQCRTEWDLGPTDL